MHTQPNPESTRPSRSWPERLQVLTAAWHLPQDEAARERLRAELWVLVVGVLDLKIRCQAGLRAGRDPTWAYDLAVQCALGIVTRLAGGEWDPRSYAPGQLQNYFSLVARNAVIDSVRSREGKRPAREFAVEDTGILEFGVPADDGGAERAAVAAALAECAGRLTPRSRRIWFLRVMCEVASRRVGAHPQVAMSPAAVDMALTRANRKLRECLRRKGYAGADFGPGAFVACWEKFRQEWRLSAPARKDGS